VTELLGYPAEELVGARIHDFLPDTPAGKARSQEVHLKHLAGETVSGWQLEMRRKDGRPLWINLWMEGGLDTDGLIQPARAIFVDITDRVLAEAERARLQEQNLYLQEEIKSAHNFEQIIGRSPSLMEVLAGVDRVAPTDASVLVTGETGTGKELIARAIHSASKRRDKPLIKVNCAALPAGLVESELFGHEKGAFSGAIARRLGRFELADGGTLFLDEVGELPAEAQAKLLRVLQEREFERVGGDRSIRVDVRVIAATNRDLLKEVQEKRFRDDLYYRLNVFPVRLPPLRERREDIPTLVHFLVDKFAPRIGKPLDGVSRRSMQRLQEYSWPGNVRELENVLERAVILETGAVLDIDPSLLPLSGDFTATIDWGDGTSSAGVVAEDASAVLHVTGSHTYAQSGAAIPIHVTIADKEGSTTTALSTAVVAQPTASPSIREFGVPTPNGLPIGITHGPDGNLWFTERHAIGRITTAGAVTEFSAGISPNSEPFGITAGPDGNLWFAEFTGHQIGRLDLSLAAAGTTINTTEGQPFVGTVATFTDGDPSAGPGSFTATINWGDGTTTAGQVLEDASGTFSVSGSHTYAEEGSAIPFLVTIVDQDGRTTAASSVANVAQAPLLAAGVPVGATKGQVVPPETTVATFIDTGGAHPLGDYAALIKWGDGTATDEAAIRLSGGDFQVISVVPHTYKVSGNFTILVLIQDLDPTNPRVLVGATFAGSTATVADARLTEVAVDTLPSRPKGTPLAGAVVGSFFDGNPFAPPADFTATIDRGDGSPLSLGTITQPNGPGSAFVVTGDHTYTVDRATPYAITVAVLDRGGRGLTTGTGVTVTDTPPIASGIPVRMTRGVTFTAPVAYIVEGAGLPPEVPGHFAATIDWGDGSSSAGIIEAVPGGEWVVGGHTYAGAGPFTITVTIHDDSGFTVATTTQAFDPPAGPAGPLHHRRHGLARAHHRSGRAAQDPGRPRRGPEGAGASADPVCLIGPPHAARSHRGERS
jgi:PAS domain S-box-containing protein